MASTLGFAISAADPSFENSILSVVTSVCSKKAKKFRDAGFCLTVTHDKIIDCVTSCVLLARLSDILKWQKDLGHVYSNSLSPGIPWIVKVSVFTSIKELCPKINEGLKDSDQSAQHADISSLVIELFNSLSPKVIDCISIVKIAQLCRSFSCSDQTCIYSVYVQVAASECLQELTKLYSDLPEVPISKVPFKSELLHKWEIENNEQANSLMKNCIDMIATVEQKSL
ncbi:ARM repeat superfamily protein [Artemisia annua]|uniref:ARM repeat superfamily protein n=1 Tax=Artemisia annua TaxID=35608 RepID=A0A2U1MJX8_ARTAN|nr:ARM repeat superfamily protein [Artemisia annua]